MFECISCGNKGKTFHVAFAGVSRGTYHYQAKCPKCGSGMVSVTGAIQEQDLRLTEKTEVIGEKTTETKPKP